LYLFQVLAVRGSTAGSKTGAEAGSLVGAEVSSAGGAATVSSAGAAAVSSAGAAAVSPAGAAAGSSAGVEVVSLAGSEVASVAGSAAGAGLASAAGVEAGADTLDFLLMILLTNFWNNVGDLCAGFVGAGSVAASSTGSVAFSSGGVTSTVAASELTGSLMGASAVGSSVLTGSVTTGSVLSSSVGGVEDSTLSGAFGASFSTGAAAGSVDFVSVLFQIDSFRTLERKLGLLSFSSGFVSETDVGSTAIDSGSSLTGASFSFAFSPCKNFPFSFWKRLGLEVSAILASGSGAASVALAVDQFSSHLVKSVQKFTVKAKKHVSDNVRS
jgi:hypothetical protein